MLIGTLNHVKVKRLKKLLKVQLYCAMGILESLWQLCMECCDEGNIGKFSNEEIADHIEWDGDADLLIDSLTQSGWVDACEEHRLVIHDWFEHCPQFIRNRVQTRRARGVKKSKREGNQREITTYDTQNQHTCSDAYTSVEAPTHVGSISDHISSHPITSDHISSSCPASDEQTTGQEAQATPTPEVFSLGVEFHVWPDFVVTGAKSHREAKWTITDGHIAEWAQVYPAIDVRQECLKAHAWIKANWERRKTYAGYQKYLLSWLDRRQNDNRSSPSGKQQFIPGAGQNYDPSARNNPNFGRM